ncbi:MAG: hypothetical protein ACRCYU_14560 [Nocardioides sp.]
MPRGGARNRSGPKPNPDSGRSDARGYVLAALPAEGYSGPVPDFPLPWRRVLRWEHDDNRRFQVCDEDETELVAERERALWEFLWRTPQACAWSMPSESWRLHTIAMYVRTFVICEGDQASAADKGSLHRFADQIGMTTAGLAEMGWSIAAAAAIRSEPEAPARRSSRDRLKVVQSG